jgi:hypothetical protein
MLYLIQHYLSDGRMVRIVGDDMAQWVPLTKGQFSGEYDVIVDDSPTSPNEKEKTWQILQGILPGVKEMITPQVMLTLLDYSPLPTSLVEKLKTMGRQQMQQAQDPQANPAVMLEQAKLANENKQIELQMMQEQIKSKELDVKMAELQQKLSSDAMTAETERGRQNIDQIEAYAHLAEATRPPEPQSVN